MPVYIAVEVSRRELEARLLLGLVAAERGYDVVLGKIPHRALLRGELNGWRLPPGILHLKSIASSQRIYERLDRMRAGGMLITVQDEEHGLSAHVNYADFGLLRFPEEGLRRVDRLMAWGPIDMGWLRSVGGGLASRVVQTGSPRIDLWRTDVIGSAKAPMEADGYVLVASSSSPFARNPFWVQLHNMRAGSFGQAFTDDPGNSEADFYDDWAESFRYVRHLTRAVRRLATAHPDRTIVVRPHHFELPEAWEAAIGDVPNVVVRADGSSRGWVRNAAVVVHGASTLAIEASVAHRSVVAFSPDEFLADAPANLLGVLAADDDELLVHVSAALHAGMQPKLSMQDEVLLAGRLASLEGRLAADRIVDEWEQMLPPSSSFRIERTDSRKNPILAVRRAFGRLGGSADILPTSSSSAAVESGGDKGPLAMEVEHKFPSLDLDALRADADRLASHLKRFGDVEIIRIGDREVLIRRAD